MLFALLSSAAPLSVPHGPGYSVIVSQHGSRIALHYQGQDRLALDGDGNLVISADGRETVQELPAVFQREGKSIRLVSAAYVIGADGIVELRLGPHVPSRPIEIAPLIVSPSRRS